MSKIMKTFSEKNEENYKRIKAQAMMMIAVATQEEPDEQLKNTKLVAKYAPIALSIFIEGQDSIPCSVGNAFFIELSKLCKLADKWERNLLHEVAGDKMRDGRVIHVTHCNNLYCPYNDIKNVNRPGGKPWCKYEGEFIEKLEDDGFPKFCHLKPLGDANS